MISVLRFTPEEMALLNDAIGNLPYRVAAPLVTSINAQLAEQFAAAKTDSEDGD